MKQKDLEQMMQQVLTEMQNMREEINLLKRFALAYGYKKE